MTFWEVLACFAGYVLLIVGLALFVGAAFAQGGWRDEEKRPGYITDWTKR